MTLVETLVAMVILVMGVLGTFQLLDTANGNDSKSRAREGATNLARELLETARTTSYATLGQTDWFKPTLQGLSGGTGTVTSPSASSQQTTVSRRGYSYEVTLSWCSVDDSRDGNGAHSASVAYCSDSPTAGTADSQPEDLKRVTASLAYSVAGRAQPALVQTTTLSFTGVALPEVTALVVQSPAGLTGSPPVVASSATTTVTFRATSAGAGTMLFSVDGVEQTAGVTNNNNGTWDFAWPIASLQDGSYTIGAIAVDPFGTRGQPRTIQVKLAGRPPDAPSNVTGGYNDELYSSGSKVAAPGVVELAWDANPEGTVTGYSVEKGGTGTVVSGCERSLETSCIDLSPAGSGSTTYTVKTHYTDAAGDSKSVSTTRDVSAGIATSYYFTSGTTATGGCTPSVTNGLKTDLVPTSGTTAASANVLSQTITGCMPLLPAGASLTAGTATFSGWFTNTGSKSCPVDYSQLLNSATISSGAGVLSVPGGTTTPTRYTATFTPGARTFSAGDRLSYAFGSRAGACGSTLLYYGSSTYPSTLMLPFGGGAIQKPGTPTGLTAGADPAGTKLTWTAPGGAPAPEFYRIYRDGQNYTARYDTAGATGSPVSWTDTVTGASSHTYRVTAVLPALAESPQTAAVTG